MKKGNTMKRKKSLLHGLKFLILISGICFSCQLLAQGFIIPRPISNFPPTLPDLTDHQVNVEIKDQVAEVEVEQVFYNSSNRQIEGTYYFPLPKGASISDFKMYADGKILSG